MNNKKLSCKKVLSEADLQLSQNILDTKDSNNNSKYARLFGAIHNIQDLVYFYDESAEDEKNITSDNS